MPTVAVKVDGLFELLERAMKTIEKEQIDRRGVSYGEVEERIARLSNTIRAEINCHQAARGRRRDNKRYCHKKVLGS